MRWRQAKEIIRLVSKLRSTTPTTPLIARLSGRDTIWGRGRCRDIQGKKRTRRSQSFPIAHGQDLPGMELTASTGEAVQLNKHWFRYCFCYFNDPMQYKFTYMITEIQISIFLFVYRFRALFNKGWIEPQSIIYLAKCKTMKHLFLFEKTSLKATHPNIQYIISHFK